MPELPEVETIRRELVSAIKGKTLKDFWSNWPKKVFPKPPTLKNKIVGQKIYEVRRRAKIIIIELTNGLHLTIHLKLTGQLIYKPNLPASKAGTKKSKLIYGGHPQPGGLDNLPNKFTHHIFTFRDGSRLFFNDLRKFGWIRLATKHDIDRLVADSGVEPFDKNFTLQALRQILKRYPNRPVKQLLLDQTLISGLGNIYADESCFCAGIRPARTAKSLTDQEITALFRCIPKILQLAIDKKGTSFDQYIQLNGQPGGMVPFLKVYGRGKQPCKRCKTLITKTKLNGRGTHFCSHCQS